MAETKQSTKHEDLNTVEIKREYYLPEYGITVEATSPEEAEKLAKQLSRSKSK